MPEKFVEQLKILVVDDEIAIRRYLRTALSPYAHEIIEVDNGEDALIEAVNHQPDLVILDLNLPGINGITVTQRLREWSTVPIIILSVQDQDTDKIEALDAGADDYLTKPFSVGELMARMRVALRHRKDEITEPIFKTGALIVDLGKRLVTLQDEEIQLTPTEYDLLKVFVKYAGRVITHQQMLKEVRGAGYQTEIHLLRVHVSNLRQKIEADPTNPQYIRTEPGVGYRLITD
ncbi:MAG: response regulator transcription factor [Phototrophicaceae bacterium]